MHNKLVKYLGPVYNSFVDCKKRFIGKKALDQLALASWQKQLLLLLSLGGIICLFGYQLFVAPYQQRAEHQRQFYLSILSKLQQPFSANSVQALKQNITQTQALLAQNQDHSSNINTKLQTISRLAETLDLTINTLSPDQAKQTTKLNLSGAFANNQRFLNQLNNLSNIVIIKSMDWSDSGQSLKLKLALPPIKQHPQTQPFNSTHNIFLKTAALTTHLFRTTPIAQLRYIGFSNDQTNTLALVRNQQRSRLIKIGDTLGIERWSITQITPKQITLTQKQKTYRLLFNSQQGQ